MALKLALRTLLETGLLKVRHSKGNWGTGFLIEGGYIVTACHCLPRLPDPMMQGDDVIRMFIKRFSSPKAGAQAEVIYADACSDIAILGPVSSQDALDELLRYEAVVSAIEPVRVTLACLPRLQKMKVHVRTVRGDWLSGVAFVVGTGGRNLAVQLDRDSARIPGGTSGSPVFNEKGVAVGVLKIGSINHPDYVALALPDHIPMWVHDRLQNGLNLKKVRPKIIFSGASSLVTKEKNSSRSST